MFVFLQYLNLIITSELPATELEFMEDNDELSTINVSCFVDVQEWSLCDYVASVPYTESKVFSRKRNVNTKFPGISVGCCAVRRAGFFVWNVIVIMARISLTLMVYLILYARSQYIFQRLTRGLFYCFRLLYVPLPSLHSPSVASYLRTDYSCPSLSC